MTEREPWLGHRDACSLQWSDECDCPNGAGYLAEQDGATCPYPDDFCTHECVCEVPELACLLHPAKAVSDG
jgi:hypothetical protein